MPSAKSIFSAVVVLFLGCSSSELPPPIMAPPSTPPPTLQSRRPIEQPGEPGARTVYVISDLHFGLGRASDGQWDHYEDFRWANEWNEFLQRIDEEGQGTADLVLNGDAFELWQSRAGDCQSKDPERGCSAEEALARVQKIIAAHTAELRQLGQFAMAGQNRVIIVPGNHDAALLFPEVAAAVMQATGAPPARLGIEMTGYWISRDRRIYADHGHQIGLDPNGYHDWPVPFRKEGNRWFLTRPWGEQFMQAFYNAYEDSYPIIDNIASEADAVKFALAREGQLGVLHALGKFVGFTLLKTSWTQRIDIARLKSPSSPSQTKPNDGNTGNDPRSREQIFRSYLDVVLNNLRAQDIANQSFDLYVYSHTHNQDVGFDVPGPTGYTRVVNSGAWQRVVSAAWLQREQARRNLDVRQVLVSVALEDLPACYGVVRIRPYAPTSRPQAEVLYFRATPGQPATFSATCE